jgi:hypothetical protein
MLIKPCTPWAKSLLKKSLVLKVDCTAFKPCSIALHPLSILVGGVGGHAAHLNGSIPVDHHKQARPESCGTAESKPHTQWHIATECYHDPTDFHLTAVWPGLLSKDLGMSFHLLEGSSWNMLAFRLLDW